MAKKRQLHVATAHALNWFQFDHLPEPMLSVAKDYAALAAKNAELTSNISTTKAIEKLLEAKDAAVRAVIYETQIVKSMEATARKKKK